MHNVMSVFHDHCLAVLGFRFDSGNVVLEILFDSGNVGLQFILQFILGSIDILLDLIFDSSLRSLRLPHNRGGAKGSSQESGAVNVAKLCHKILLASIHRHECKYC
jgi:hypothetical protein